MAIIRGNARKDKLNGTNGKDSIFGLGGDDTLKGKAGNDKLYGGAGRDTLDGGKGRDQLFGGSGKDTFIGGAGADKHAGGAGTDTITYARSTAAVVASLDAAALAALAASYAANGDSLPAGGDGAGDTFSSVENMIGSAFGDILLGNASANRIEGGAGQDAIAGFEGADQLFGGDGTDFLLGGAGADALDGGTGNDFASYAFSAAGVVAGLSASTPLGALTPTGEAAGDTFLSIEGLEGSDFDDFLAGDAGANTIFGGNGNDALFANGGNDVLVGDDGDDVLISGAGADQFFGGDGTDLVFYFTEVRASLTDGNAGTGEAVGDTFDGIEDITASGGNDILVGNGAANTLTGGDGNDSLFGEDGDDTLEGNAGDDFLDGGLGNDVLEAASGDDELYGGDGVDVLIGGSSAAGDVHDGGDGSDWASYEDSASGLLANLDTLGYPILPIGTPLGDSAFDTYVSIENLRGSAFDDELYGDAALAGNAIDGGGGNDIIAGRIGPDVLTGGDGADWFFYFQAGEGNDSIVDFVAGTDRIAINSGANPSYAGFEGGLPAIDGPLSAPATLDPAYFIAGTVSPDAVHGYFLFDDATDTLYWDMDGADPIAAFHLATFANGVTITASDILILVP